MTAPRKTSTLAAQHGSPCWYELSTSPGALPAAEAFYGKVLGWSVADSGMPGFDYRLAKRGDDMVAGMMVMPDEAKGMPPMWMVYFAVEDADKAVARMKKAGARVHVPVTPIPNTGRFAILGDPMGSGFGILEPLDGQTGTAFNQKKAGHGNWHELNSPDPRAAMKFYRDQFGWTPSTSMDMGDLGSYDLFSRDGTDIGGMQRLRPETGQGSGFWLPYFGVDGTEAAMERITAAGGTVKHGPSEVPGGAWIAVAADPQGASFGLVGPK